MAAELGQATGVEPYLSIKEISTLTGLSLSKLYGDLELRRVAIRLGGSLRHPASAVRAWLAAGSEDGA